MKCPHGTPYHKECLSCEIREARAEVAKLHRELSDAEVRLALLTIRKGNELAHAS